MTCAGSRKGGCSFRKCKCRRRVDHARPCVFCTSILSATKNQKKEAKKKKIGIHRKSESPRSFLVSPRFLYFSRDQKFNEWRLESTGGKGAKRGIKKGGKWTASKSASLVAVRQIYAAICASNNLAGTMKRVPTKFFSGHAAVLARDAINSRP